MKRRMRIFTGAISIMLSVATGAMPVLAEGSGKDWGEYKIDNDGYGYLTANFPDQFTSEYIVEENTVSVSQKTEALMLTLNEEEKKELLQADGYWRGISRVGIPEIVFYETEYKIPAPGTESIYASYDEENAAIYGKNAAESVKMSGANAIVLGDLKEEIEEKNVPYEKIETVLETALNKNGVIVRNSKKFCEKSVEEMNQKEIDEEVSNILNQIGKAGYFGMVQISRDGKAAVDTDVPEVIKLSLYGETDQEEEKASAIAGSVLLKNENVLPLKQISEIKISSDDKMAEIIEEEANILYIASNEKVLNEEQKKFLDEKISAAKAENKKVVLALSTSQTVDIEKWTDDCDAILEVWQSIEEEGSVLTSLLSGEAVPSGRLSKAWSEHTEEWSMGYGLSYTEFSYEVVSVALASENEEDYGLDVTVKVKNTGDFSGADTVQIYTEDGEKKILAAAKKTEVLEAGEESQIVIHISQKGLSTWKDGEWSIEEGRKEMVIGHPSVDQTVEFEAEIKGAKAGVSVQAEAPEMAAAGETFNVTVNTPVDVIGLQMMDAEGNVYQPVDVLKENMGESIKFTYTLKIDEKGTAQINIYTTTSAGLSEAPVAQVELEIQ